MAPEIARTVSGLGETSLVVEGIVLLVPSDPLSVFLLAEAVEYEAQWITLWALSSASGSLR